MTETDPRKVRLSKHFVLSDFLGCHSVYSRGYPNPFEYDGSHDQKLDNARALCTNALEPILLQFGSLSVSYGYISPELSERIVKYQDPAKPSHHMWNLGAAADICVHPWVAGAHLSIDGLFIPQSAVGSPIALAHAIDYFEVPYSRLITYSESPYICIAVSDSECEAQQPRKAFYENRYMGKPKAKPLYLQYASSQGKTKAFQLLQDHGLAHPWEGGGYPSYHGGGIKQYQHMRVSKYTMVSDWLFDLKSISEGCKNIPSLTLDSVQDSFAAAGLVYDWIIETLSIPRASIVSGYVSHMNPHFDKSNDWRKGEISFFLSLPADYDIQFAVEETSRKLPWSYVETSTKYDFMKVTLSVDDVLTQPDFEDQ